MLKYKFHLLTNLLLLKNYDLNSFSPPFYFPLYRLSTTFRPAVYAYAYKPCPCASHHSLSPLPALSLPLPFRLSLFQRYIPPLPGVILFLCMEMEICFVFVIFALPEPPMGGSGKFLKKEVPYERKQYPSKQNY